MKLPSKMRSILAGKFLFLTIGEAASLIGDQLTRVALIWLILELTGSAVAVGTWLALGAIPRAVFLLLGGALIDRFSPLTMMFASNFIRLTLVVVLVIAATANMITFFGLCVFTVLFGAAGALYTPSLPAILPRIVPASLLQTGNSLIQGMMHIANLVGPPLAAFVLAYLLAEMDAVPPGGVGQPAYAFLFAVDAATFLVSLWTLRLIGRLPESEPKQHRKKMLTDIIDGIRFVAGNPRLRVLLFVTVIANFGIGGPLAVAMPLLAKFALPQGVIALGMLSAAGATGSLLGLGVAAVLSQQETKRIFLMPFFFLPVLGLLMITLGRADSIGRATLTLGVMTAIAVYIDIQMLTWLQQATDRDYLGRVISIVQLCAFGTMPISMAIAGFLGAHLMLMFASFGSIVIGATLLLSASAVGILRRASPPQSG